MKRVLDIKRMRGAIDLGQLQWQRHVLERMMERGINRADVLSVLLHGECIEGYSGDWPLPSGLFFKWCGKHPLHVVAAFDISNETVAVITAYEPTSDYFEPDFRTRRKKL